MLKENFLRKLFFNAYWRFAGVGVAVILIFLIVGNIGLVPVLSRQMHCAMN